MTIISFVVPWYGPEVPGGAEAQARRTVRQLYREGVPVEVLTTTTRDLYADWGRGYHAPGLSVIDGVPVRRFPVQKRDRAAFDALNLRLMSNQPIAPAAEQTFIREMIRVPALYDFMAEEADRRLYVFLPYMFSTTYEGVQVCPERSMIIPCLHDESYARLGIYRQVIPTARALAFNTASELRLANRLYPARSGQIREVLGEGVDTDGIGQAARFRANYGLDGPLVLYAGRRESGKNTPLLIDYWARYWRAAGRARQARLLLIGPGEVAIPPAADTGIIDLGFIPAQDKLDALAAASIFCLPSIHESFSIVLMESWLQGTPALVHGHCEVTVEHCRRANGGLYFTDYDEFAATIEYLFDHPTEASLMARNGRRYVLENYQWSQIIPRYRALFARVLDI